VRPIEPSSGDEVDPTRHEVVHREDDDADSIASVYRRGYEMGGTVIRPAQVTVGAIENPETANSEPDEEPS
jgi:molecular chaperone GrpE